MERATRHHHFKQSRSAEFNRVERCERYVIDLLLQTDLPDDRRQSSIAFELMHHHGVAQMARILARKRNLSLDVCVVGSLLHDIEVIVRGTYKDHAHRGAARALTILEELGGFTPEELELIHDLVYYHSDKDVVSENPYIEFGKDADILDIFLLVRDPYAEYLLTKPLGLFKHYLRRAKQVWLEIGLPQEPRFSLLDTYHPNWFRNHELLPLEEFLSLLSMMTPEAAETLSPPPLLALSSPEGLVEVYFNGDDWQEYGAALKSGDQVSQPNLSTPSAIVYLTREALHLQRRGSQQSHTSDEIGRILTATSSAVALWPLIDIYEVVETDDRLHEFGVPSGRTSLTRSQ
jgi:HD domain